MKDQRVEAVAEREFAMLDQDDQRSRSWANRWLAQQGLNLKRARKLEAARWHFATKGTIGRWFTEMAHVFEGIRPEMVWNFDELMAAASRGGKVVVTGERAVFSPTSRKTPHVTLGACFNCRGTPLFRCWCSLARNVRWLSRRVCKGPSFG
jgi:hypothetical protein